MNEVKLKKITLSHFKGMNHEVTFKEGSTLIKGCNGIGKSSIQKAWTFLLTGYSDAFSPQNSMLFDDTKPLDSSTPAAVVTAVIDINGIEYKMSRLAQPKFAKRKDTGEYEKQKSDTYKYYIDDIQMTATEYNNFISANICDASMIKFACDGNFFFKLVDENKEKARNMLEGLVDVSSIDPEGDFESIKDFIAKGYSIEQVMKHANEKINEIKNDTVSIPAMITDKQSKVKDLEEIGFDKIEKDIESKKKQISDIDNEILGISEKMKPFFEEREKKMNQLVTLRSAYDDAKYEHERLYKQKRKEIKDKIDEIKKHNTQVDVQNEINKQENAIVKEKITNLEVTIESLKSELDGARDLLHKTKEKQYNLEKCPVCGGELPESIKEEKIALFIEEKQKEIDAIVKRGKSIKSKINVCENELSVLKSTPKKDVIKKKTTGKLEEELKQLEESHIPFEDTDRGKHMLGEIDNFVIPSVPESSSASLTEKKNELIREIFHLSSLLANRVVVEQLLSEIKEMKDRYKVLGVESMRYEKMKEECVRYKQKKMGMLSNVLNGLLKYCTVDIWSKLKDGSYVPDLIVRDKQGVSYGTTNNASRGNICFDIKNMFCHILDVQLPSFVDEASIYDENHLPKNDGQCIYMVCTNNKKLTVS